MTSTKKRHKIWIEIIGILASVITLIIFLTGKPYLSDYWVKKKEITRLDSIKNRISTDTLERLDLSKTVKDPDGNLYRTINLTGLTWLAENLNYPIEKESWCYENSPILCEQYGRLYTWEAARRACKSLGAGWRLPTIEEWDNLAKSFKDQYEAFESLIKGGNSGFEASLSGYKGLENFDFKSIGRTAYYWSSTINTETNELIVEAGHPDYFWFVGTARRATKMQTINKGLGCPCRCIKTQ